MIEPSGPIPTGGQTEKSRGELRRELALLNTTENLRCSPVEIRLVANVIASHGRAEDDYAAAHADLYPVIGDRESVLLEAYLRDTYRDDPVGVTAVRHVTRERAN